jgi:hypothetical protein
MDVLSPIPRVGFEYVRTHNLGQGESFSMNALRRTL